MKYTIINRKGTLNVILIHGLFASSGYWLNYLNHFRNCKLVILDLNYNESINFTSQINNIELLIDELFNGEVDYIFSHSLGTVIALGVSEKKFKLSFEICPVHSSKRRSKSNFVNNILEKTSNNNDEDFIKNKLKEVDFKLNLLNQQLMPSNKRIIFYPNNDIHFEYNLNTPMIVRDFEGDHFSIENALIDSFSIINSKN